ncbi:MULTISPECIES: hypothetical protein [unclassified Leptospira]|uniref:hypothetical protein n=1 Tax=unclassified Leptospira TaxID=2633828 RepID=UPI00055A8C75|nr:MULTISPECIES: hypothetical protein [unclassified Leptospira]MCR1795759.1 hypothetical protein [Leptospira sp. id769339]
MQKYTVIETDLFLKNLKEINWDGFKCPDGYNSTEPPFYIEKLLKIEIESEKWTIYNSVIYSIGNNHAGSYYLPIEKALPFIFQIAFEGQSELARNCSLEILTDILCSFSAELVDGDEADCENLDNRVRMFYHKHIGDFKIVSIRTNESERNKDLAIGIIEAIDEITNSLDQ